MFNRVSSPPRQLIEFSNTGSDAPPNKILKLEVAQSSTNEVRTVALPHELFFQKLGELQQGPDFYHNYQSCAIM